MARQRKSKNKAEFGDFQTPSGLAQRACDVLVRRGVSPRSILEPTCGIGNFLFAALDKFPTATKAVGLEINPKYVAAVRLTLERRPDARKVRLVQGDFFATDWQTDLVDFPDPLLVIGNPPWVTNAELGTLGSTNLPKKSNFQGHAGFDALTGKSNFDISEWMLIRFLEWLDGRDATVAMLAKTTVARKVLKYAWKHGIGLADSAIYQIDAGRAFNAAVDACLLVCTLSNSPAATNCSVYQQLADVEPASAFGYVDGRLVADTSTYDQWKHLSGDEVYRWRSGVKHDCSRVMEFVREGQRYRNGLGELIDLEDTYLYPMVKSSHLANGSTKRPTRWMLVTQKGVSDDTSLIRQKAPKTWRYLLAHGERLDARASSIYTNRPRFSVFGIGDYSFATWKVAISGFYKKLEFTKVGSYRGKPIVLDDTAYFVACHSEEEADYIASLLNSDAARAFYSAFIFWDAKRPITIATLRRLDLRKLARDAGSEDVLLRFPVASVRNGERGEVQKTLFESSTG